jgi:glutaminyl-peptide cyclotransferase
MHIARSCRHFLALVLLALPLHAQSSAARSELPAFDATRALGHIHALMAFTPRSMGAPGHEQTLAYIEAQLHATAHIQAQRETWAEMSFDGQTMGMSNLVARLNPQLKERMLLGTHYDSIVRAYRDPDTGRRSQPMPGANNSASGVAMLLELARVLSQAHPALGVDFVFFDGEEGPLSLGAGDPHWRALGSPYFARHASQFYPAQLPVAALLFDMVCKRDIRLHPERSSLESAPQDSAALWALGQQLAPANFPQTPQGTVLDDHTALAALGIPSLLLIDFDYEPWFNTTEDTEDKCSRESLQAVGSVASAFTASRLRRAGP